MEDATRVWDNATSAASSAWDSAAATWDQVVEDTATGWKYLYNEAQRAYLAEVEADPEAFRPDAENMAKSLAETRANLEAIKAALPPNPTTPAEVADRQRYEEAAKRYNALAAPFYADAMPAYEHQVGVVPLLVVAGIALGAGAIAWAPAAYGYTEELQAETALQKQELEARVAASKEGRTLQPSTLPPQDGNTTRAAKGMGIVLLGGAAAMGLVFVLTRR